MSVNWMVAPNVRVPLDFYETPAWQTRVLAHHVSIEGHCYEPCVGNGAIPNALDDGRRLGKRYWRLNDIDPHWPADTHLDATTPEAWTAPQVDWVVSNFPFGVATPIVKHAHRIARVGVAVLLRLSWLEPTADRREFLGDCPPDLLIVLPRTRYNPNSKSVDSVTTAWMVWYTAHGEPDQFSHGRTGIIVHPERS